MFTSGTVWSPNMERRTERALATITSSGRDSNLTAASPAVCVCVCVCVCARVCE